MANKEQYYIEYLDSIENKTEQDKKLIELLKSGDENIELAYNIIEGLATENKVYKNLIEKFEVRDVSDVLAERQNIATDNMKELVMHRVNINSETLDVDKVLVLLGFDKDMEGNSIPFYFLKSTNIS